MPVSLEREIVLIELRNVTKMYENDVLALEKINLTIDKGEFVFVIGTSGSGKSTLIRMLLKELEPTSGDILINGQSIVNLKHKEVPFLRRKMGVVFQDFRLLPNKTVFENVAFAMQVVEAAPKDIRRTVPAIISMVGLNRKARAYPNQLSGGEQQRVALARAIVNSPPILIADEPTGNLDPETAWEIINLLKDINMRGTTVVVASHAKEIVDVMQKRVIALQKGVLVRDSMEGRYDHED